jgi:hypothetical protein
MGPSNQSTAVNYSTSNNNYNFVPVNSNKLNQGPMNVTAYPSQDTQPKNFHLNMNITNININNQKNSANLMKKVNQKPIFRCDRDEKVKIFRNFIFS